MKVPFSWLKELVDIDVTAQELEEKLFSCGFEVEELIPLDAGISKVVVGKIVEMEPQEGTHLTKCVVDCGEYGHDIRISTGAANMKLGDCVPAALDGSTLPGGIKIKARKMQGVESNGMLCSGEELGLNDDLFPGSEVYGLLILPEDSVPGTDIAPVVGLDDYIFDISITANRPDCQSVLGIAREVAAILGKPLHMPAMDYNTVCDADEPISVKDYRETESAEYDKWCDEVFDRAVNFGMLKAYSEAMDKIPKIIVPEDKKNYEYLLERCDAFVKQHRGYIKGIVDYHRWHAEINMFLPFAEFDDSEDLAFLKEIAEKSQTVCFSPDEEGGIRVHIFINYFEELMSAEHKSYIEYDAIMQDKKLSELLGIPELSDEEKELALKMKGILDRIDEETRIDRPTAFRAVLDKMTKEPEENWSLHYMATLLEALLYFMLNEGNEKIDEEEHNE